MKIYSKRTVRKTLWTNIGTNRKIIAFKITIRTTTTTTITRKTLKTLRRTLRITIKTSMKTAMRTTRKTTIRIGIRIFKRLKECSQCLGFQNHYCWIRKKKVQAVFVQNNDEKLLCKNCFTGFTFEISFIETSNMKYRKKHRFHSFSKGLAT